MAARFGLVGWAMAPACIPRPSRWIAPLATVLQVALFLTALALLREVAAERVEAAAPPVTAVPTLLEPLPADPPPAPVGAPEPDAVLTPAPAAAAPPSDQPTPGFVRISAMVTGYCPCPLCCGEEADGHTAIRRDVHRHPAGIAVDPALIPYRTLLEVPGYGIAMVDDTGAAMRRDGARGIIHLDVRFRTHAEARAWGVRWLTIEVPADCGAAALPTPSAAVVAEAEPNLQ
jgi:3D (Asp-Asp-Asp) domain-containing protein